jgi:polygalacturonase
MDWLNKVCAKSFLVSKKIFNVNNYSTVRGTVTVNTQAIQKTIADCAAKGGGIVTFNMLAYKFTFKSIL